MSRDREEESHDRQARPQPAESLPGAAGAGQAGDTQGLDEYSEAAEESVAALSEEDQPFEAEVISGVEEAGDHPERPVRTHEDRRPAHESELPPEADWK